MEVTSRKEAAHQAGSSTSSPDVAALSGSSLMAKSVSQSLDRGLEVLCILGGTPVGMSVAELAVAAGLHRTIVTRILKTLTRRGFVSRAADGRYHLGPQLLQVTRLIYPELQQVALPVLQRLADRLRSSSHLTVADDQSAVTLAVVAPRTAPVLVTTTVGASRPLARGASGIALLAARVPAQGEPVAVKNARQRGWAVSVGQIHAGCTGVSVAVDCPRYHGEHSIGVVMHGEVEQAEAVGAELLRAARFISSRLA